MIVIADTHVHLYPSYDIDAALARGLANLKRLAAPFAEPCVLAMFLTERRDCHAFASLKASGAGEVRVSRCADEGALRIERQGVSAYLFAGRQIATQERLEVLCLTADCDVPDGLALREALARVQSSGGKAILPWSPGKWSLGRGRLVARVAKETADSVLLADSALRPRGWPMPRVLRSARGKVLAGSDPLPLAGEEQRLGTFATVWRAGFDEAHPVAAARSLLDSAPLGTVGSRLSLWGLARRLHRLAARPK